ncbi:hypothetical protein BU16DRAFT_515299 [Lophium mytilinum]|uniref:CNH domain-containing protein n=1 Tax=Lophium mytilinum TaxID=390894 RepID=A0A6A6QIX9_9PEZI|nr:hypothetical protein BU16DRAFT_515299 [Lophium mytilinum]
METAIPSDQLRLSSQAQNGSYILRKLVSDIPLSADGPTADVRITCVEVWNGNLYIGTSAAEIIHYVLIPPEPNDPSGEPTAIFASRFPVANTHALTGPGVQQILPLPSVDKACILCNNTLTFHSLPELTPAFPNTKPLSCTWVGGVDLNADYEDRSSDDGVVIMICQRSRIRLARVSEEGPRSLRTIEYGGCPISVRRDDFACVADAHSYALLDVENQQKIGLCPISSLDPDGGDVGGGIEDIPPGPPSHNVSRSVSSASTRPATLKPQEETRGHSRSTSLGIFSSGARTESPRRPTSQRYGFDVPESLQRTQSPAAGRSRERPAHPERTTSLPRTHTPTPEKPLPPPPTEVAGETAAKVEKPFVPLEPHVVSPSPSEFLLTRGTIPSEPGFGMFVNLEGDFVRGTIEFSNYPDALVVDGSGVDMASSLGPEQDAEEGYILATMHWDGEKGVEYGVELQRWDVDLGEGHAYKEWLDVALLPGSSATSVPGKHTATPLGIRNIVAPNDIVLSEIGEKLSVKRLSLSVASGSSTPAKQAPVSRTGRRTAQEQADFEFTERLSKLQTHIVLWADNQVWWVVRSPLVIKLDAQLEQAQYTPNGDGVRIQPSRELVEHLLNEIRGQEPRSESEYLGLIYIRQKASILLFMELILRSTTNIIIFESEKRTTEDALIQGEVDPRVILALLPILEKEVVEGPEGITISGGLTTLVEQFLAQNDLSAMPATVNGPFGDNLLQLVKRFLFSWKRRKGMASVTNDPHVFQTVDAALLHILLLLDRDSPKGPATAGSIRSELNDVVDREVECFDRAVALLEDFKRLYVLSRLYQSNSRASSKATKVLATWKRILEGETDEGGEFVDGEQEMRKYLARIRDQSLFEEYGSYLANRNPKLGVQVFTDDHSRVKFEPNRAVALLKEKAPGAVKEYLEHLVFGKKHTKYVNDLIAFYLDIVITELETSPDSRATLLQTYETYRALTPPKPTYRHFVTENSIGKEWWNSRLRLLQLLGSNQGAASSYDVPTILSRLEPYEQELVPEMIILNGRQGRHEEAIRLLTHGLGDFDTAISYCLLGGSSIFRPPSGFVPQEAIPSREEQARLFGFLLHEFLRIEDLSERIERTGELLERFGGWFDVATVLSMIPDSWSIEIFSGFLINALRRLVRERSETSINKALSGAQNLKTSEDLIDRAEELGPTVERVM